MVEDIYYILYTIFFIFVFMIIEIIGKKQYSRKQFCILFAILLLLGLGLRHIDQGLRDTKSVYKNLFETVNNYTFGELIGTYYARYTSLIFVWMVKLIRILSFGKFRVFMFITAALFVFPIEYLIYKKCENIMLANLFFIVLLYPYGFFVVRQCISVGLVALAIGSLPDRFSRQNKKKVGIVLISSIFAVLIHPICSIFFGVSFLIYFMNRINKMDMVNWAIIAVTILILIVPASFTFVFDYLPENTKYKLFVQNNHYLSGDLWLSAFVVYAFLGLYLFMRYKNKECNSTNKALVGYSLCALMFVATTNIIQDLVRISFFFFPVEMVLLTKEDTFTIGKDKSIMKIITKILVYVYCFFVILPQNNIIRWSL